MKKLDGEKKRENNMEVYKDGLVVCYTRYQLTTTMQGYKVDSMAVF